MIVALLMEESITYLQIGTKDTQLGGGTHAECTIAYRS